MQFCFFSGKNVGKILVTKNLPPKSEKTNIANWKILAGLKLIFAVGFFLVEVLEIRKKESCYAFILSKTEILATLPLSQEFIWRRKEYILWGN